MKKLTILLTGATGYVGKRLLPLLVQQGHAVICAVRDPKRFPNEGFFAHPLVSVIRLDLLDDPTNNMLPSDIDAAFYLVHSMGTAGKEFEELESLSAINFIRLISTTKAKQLIYLGGITNSNELSPHLSSRRRVEDILASGPVPLTVLRAGIILGSGSASFEIIRDLVEKLPIMVAPKWLNTRSQPIAIRNVLEYLTGVLMNRQTLGQTFDIGGPEVLTYKQILLKFARVRGLTRYIFTVPVMTPRLSSYWLYFVTSTSFRLAMHLVESMKTEVVASDNRLQTMLGIEPIPYDEAVKLAFQRIAQDDVASSWKDAYASSMPSGDLPLNINVPVYGCFTDKRMKPIHGEVERVVENIWSIGGENGWYYANWLWRLRGFADKLAGGVGLRRGRTNAHTIHAGDTLDFWRVMLADKEGKRLLLYAEMKLPGEAWLEFKIVKQENMTFLKQTATFRPHGLAGRMYWYLVMPFHFFVFNGMANNLIKNTKLPQLSSCKP